jgi:hypothetical protein
MMNKLNITEKKLKGRTRIIVETALETEKRIKRRENIKNLLMTSFIILMYVVSIICVIYFENNNLKNTL